MAWAITTMPPLRLSHAESGSSAAPGSPRHTALDASDRCADRAAASRTTALPNQQPPGKHGAHHCEPWRITVEQLPLQTAQNRLRWTASFR